MYNEYYNGSSIFFDTDVTDEAKNSISNIENDILDYCDGISSEDKYFDDVPSRYKKLIPNIRYSDIISDIEIEMVDAKDKFFNSIKAIENAIRDYCDGDGVISLENKAILDFYLGNKPPFYNNESDNKNNITKEELDNSNDEEISANSVNILENRNEDYDAKFSDEELSLNSGSTISSSVVVNSLKEDDKDNITMSDVGTSLYSNYAYQMSTGKSDNDKENGTLINPNDIAMAAIAALTGKIIYDKQQETDDENVSNSVENTSFNNNYVDENTSEINSVEFKKDLFDEMDGDN